MSETYTLSEPISHGGQEIKVLEIREIRTGHIRRIGEPVTFKISASGDGTMEFVQIPDRIFAYVQAMTGLSGDAVDLLAPADYVEISGRVQAFFTDLSLGTALQATSEKPAENSQAH